jgi:hypothetical protein
MAAPERTIPAMDGHRSTPYRSANHKILAIKPTIDGCPMCPMRIEPRLCHARLQHRPGFGRVDLQFAAAGRPMRRSIRQPRLSRRTLLDRASLRWARIGFSTWPLASHSTRSLSGAGQNQCRGAFVRAPCVLQPLRLRGRQPAAGLAARARTGAPARVNDVVDQRTAVMCQESDRMKRRVACRLPCAYRGPEQLLIRFTQPATHFARDVHLNQRELLGIVLEQPVQVA